MSDGRTLWYPQDARWLAWDSVIELGEEFGPGGPLVMVAITSEAKLQANCWRVKVGLRTIARESFVKDPETVRAIIVRSAAIGLLDEVEFAERTVTCKVSGMAASERKARDAQRKASGRAGADTPDETGHDRTDPDKETADPMKPGDLSSADTADRSGHDRTEAEKKDRSDALSRDSRGEERTEEDKELSNESSRPTDPEAQRLAIVLSDSIRQWTDTPPSSRQHLPGKKWAGDLDKLHRLDGRSWQDIEQMIAWLALGGSDALFWQGVVLSAESLRKGWDKIAVQRRRSKPTLAPSDLSPDRIAEIERRAEARNAAQAERRAYLQSSPPEAA